MSEPKKIEELERMVEIMKLALLKLQEWMDGVNDISKIDADLFDSLNERVTRLENSSEENVKT